MATEAQASALNALEMGAFLTPADIVAGLETEDRGEDLIITRHVLALTAPRRTQRWRIGPDGSPRLELDGTRLH